MPILPDKDVANALIAAGVATTLGTDIVFGEPLSPVEPGAAGVKLWVYSMSSAGPVPYFGAASSEYDVTIQVRVRDVAGDGWVASQTLARSVIPALHCHAPAGYFWLTCDVSEPLYLGPNEAGQHEWSVPFTLKWIG